MIFASVSFNAGFESAVGDEPQKAHQDIDGDGDPELNHL